MSRRELLAFAAGALLAFSVTTLVLKDDEFHPTEPVPFREPRLATMKVPGGTIYRVEGGDGLCFVPDTVAR